MATKIQGSGIDTDTDTITAGNIAAGAVGASEIATGAVGVDEIATGAVGADEIATGAVGAAEIEDGAIAFGDVAAGFVVQVVNVQSGVLATGSTVMPNDDSIPQNDEGFEVMALSITPKSATNKLKIDVVANLASSATGNLIAALFKENTAAALAATSEYTATANGSMQLVLTHWMTAGTTSALPLSVRVGCNNAATVTFNGASGARLYGGVMASSITIAEIKA